MNHQKGHIFRVKRSWYGRWWRDEMEKKGDGTSQVVRRQHCEKLCEYGDRYRSKKDVQSVLDGKLQPLNEGRCPPERTLAEFLTVLSTHDLRRSVSFLFHF